MMNPLVNILKEEIVRQSESDWYDAPWIDATDETIIRIDGYLNLADLAKAVALFMEIAT